MTFPARAALVICDMWDTHHCVTAAERARDLAPRIGGFAARLRAAGALIIHAPGDCVAYYDMCEASEPCCEAGPPYLRCPTLTNEQLLGRMST